MGKKIFTRYKKTRGFLEKGSKIKKLKVIYSQFFKIKDLKLVKKTRLPCCIETR